MQTSGLLHHNLSVAVARHPQRIAVVEPGHGEITYRELDSLSGRLRDRLCAIGVRRGDRVGIYMRKSIDAIVAIYGILKAGAAYVPVDPTAPPERNAYIMHNCAVAAAIVEERLLGRFRDELGKLGALPKLIVLPQVGAGKGLKAALDAADAEAAAPASTSPAGTPADLAYILYTSGSTGRPKGVMLSHENATSFVDWCSSVFEPREDDRFSSHAPLHFDLSILDIHVSLKHGAAVVLVAEDVGKDPQKLAPWIAEQRITIWYSAPSILSLLAQYGNLDRYDYSRLRMVLFAGEVFPVKHLRTLSVLLPAPRYFNLYGPTETNVCTFYEVRLPIAEDRTVPFPIGRVCSHLRGRVTDERGVDVKAGEEGELCITGAGVMQGYWSLDELTAKSFLVDSDGRRWYRTGDIVVESPGEGYIYRGRRDRMVKRRGYRVELGEIESGLYRHPALKEVAVVAVPDEEAGVRITAHLSCREVKRPSLIELKRFCAEHLPIYMIPDRFQWHESLPKTTTDKIDYQGLKAIT
jgi:amino acid adenylation domain-containing protein